MPQAAIPRSTQRAVWLRAEGLCERCRGPETVRLTVHHRLPRVAGGTHELENLELLCKSCHLEADRVTQKPERRGGRRKGSGRYDYEVTGYFSGEETAALEWLAERWRCSLSEALRRSVREEAARLGLGGRDE